MEIILGKKSDSPNDPDYVPTVNMEYTVSTADPLSSKKRFERTQNRSAIKQSQVELEACKTVDMSAAEALLDLSNTNEKLILPSENMLPSCENHAGNISEQHNKNNLL